MPYFRTCEILISLKQWPMDACCVVQDVVGRLSSSNNPPHAAAAMYVATMPGDLFKAILRC